MGMGVWGWVARNLHVTNWRGLSRSSCGLWGVRQLGESAWALASRHMLGIFELRCDAFTHVVHLCFVGLLKVAFDGSPHHLGHLGLELLSLLSRFNFGLLQSNNVFSDCIYGCRGFHFLAHTCFLNRWGTSSDLELHLFLCICLCLGQIHAILQGHRIIIRVGQGGGRAARNLDRRSLKASESK